MYAEQLCECCPLLHCDVSFAQWVSNLVLREDVCDGLETSWLVRSRNRSKSMRCVRLTCRTLGRLSAFKKNILGCGLIIFQTHHAWQVMDSEEHVAENCPNLFQFRSVNDWRKYFFTQGNVVHGRWFDQCVLGSVPTSVDQGVLPVTVPHHVASHLR